MPREDFEEQRLKSRAVEIAIASWLMKSGYYILPVYDYSGLSDNKAPKLQAFSSEESQVTPDLLAARNGLMCWYEVKYKTKSDYTWITKKFETGINRRLWRSYRKVKEYSGANVHIVFCHKKENIVTCDELQSLIALYPREYEGDKMGPDGMVFWPLEQLTRVGKYSDIVMREAA